MAPRCLGALFQCLEMTFEFPLAFVQYLFQSMVNISVVPRCINFIYRLDIIQFLGKYVMKKFYYVILALISTVSGCGGGGDSPSSTVSPPQVVVRQPVLSVPSPSYAEVKKQDAFNRINAIEKTGFGANRTESKTGQSSAVPCGIRCCE